MTHENKPQAIIENEEIAWGVFFTPKMIDSTTMMDNGKVWHPLAIFEDMTEAMNYRKEKNLGNPTNSNSDVQLKEVRITYKP